MTNDAYWHTPLPPLTFTRSEVKVALSAIRRQRRTVEKEVGRQAFVPEPGHRDINKLRLATLQELEQKLTALFEISCLQPD